MRRIIIAVALLGVLVAGACKPAEPAGPKKKVIGAALLTQTHIFYQDLVNAFKDEAAKRGFTTTEQYAEFDGSKQNDQIDTFILQGVDALVVAPTDSENIASAIAQARAQNIPVFTVDIAAHGADVISHVASDNVEGGRQAAEYLAKLLNGKGKVAIIDHPAVASVQDRTKGFDEVMAKYPDITVVQRAAGGGQRDKAHQATQDLLQAHPDLNGIFAINDDSALGALAAVEAAGLADKIVIVGFDGTPEARDTIKRGTALKADVVQYPEKIGRKTVEVIADFFEGKEVPKVVPVEVGVVDQQSLNAESTK